MLRSLLRNASILSLIGVDVDGCDWTAGGDDDRATEGGEGAAVDGGGPVKVVLAVKVEVEVVTGTLGTVDAVLEDHFAYTAAMSIR